jgi:hypothetical protein
MKDTFKKARTTRRCWIAACLALASAGLLSAAEWTIEPIDRSGVGRYSSMKIDSSGNVHVAYVVDDGNRFPLKYGFWDHALKRWFVMNVADGASFCSLALDSKQRPHISYADPGTGSGAKLHYARWDGTKWNTQAIPLNSDIIGYFTSIVLDSNDRPSISFYEYRGPKDTDIKIRLRNVMWSGSSWQVKTIDDQEGSGKFNAMDIDASGHIHLAYANVSANTAGLRYAFWNGEVWKAEIVDGLEQNKGESVGYSANVVVDKDGNPHIAYMNESTSQLKYAVRRNNMWQTQTVDQLAGVGYPDRNSIAIDEDGHVHIGYYDAGRGLLKIAHQDGAKWTIETVARGASGATSSLQISNETIWVSYADESNAGITVARRPLTKSGDGSNPLKSEVSQPQKPSVQ